MKKSRYELSFDAHLVTCGCICVHLKTDHTELCYGMKMYRKYIFIGYIYSIYSYKVDTHGVRRRQRRRWRYTDALHETSHTRTTNCNRREESHLNSLRVQIKFILYARTLAHLFVQTNPTTNMAGPVYLSKEMFSSQCTYHIIGRCVKCLE